MFKRLFYIGVPLTEVGAFELVVQTAVHCYQVYKKSSLCNY